MGLLLNFAPLQIDDAEIDVGLFPYGTDGVSVLEHLRKQHGSTHVFRREGPHHIVAVPVTADAPRLTEDTKKIRLKENLGLAASLIRNSLIGTLAGLGRSVLNYDPIRFIARDDLLRSCLASGLTCPDWLAVRLLYDLAVRPSTFSSTSPLSLPSLTCARRGSLTEMSTTSFRTASLRQATMSPFACRNTMTPGSRRDRNL